MTDPAEPAARRALAAFGVTPLSIEPAARSENITFRVESAEGAYALRLHRPGYNSIAELEAERVWTAALAGAGFAVPVALKTLEGRDYVPVTLPDGEVRQAGVTRWIPGELLEKAITDQNMTPWFARLGEIAARLHAHSAAWTPPPGFTRRVLDADGLMGEAPSWGPFWRHAGFSHGEQTLMARARARLHAMLAALPRDRQHFGMIHADLHHRNLVIDGEALSIIDFDDAGFGWYVNDLAVALMHQQGRPNFSALQAALLAGYRARRPLSAEEEARLPMFLLVRRLAVIGWLHQRPEVDAAQYVADMKPLTLQMCETFLARGVCG